LVPGVLDLLAVDGAAEGEVVGVGELVGRDHPRLTASMLVIGIIVLVVAAATRLRAPEDVREEEGRGLAATGRTARLRAERHGQAEEHVEAERRT
jgi:hypothetical protein